MTVITAFFAIVCYTSTLASCLKFEALPDAQACTEVYATIKAKRSAARLEQCGTYRMISGDYLLAR